MDDISEKLEEKRREIRRKVIHQMASRTLRSSYELKNASMLVLRGQRSGREYNVPGTGRVKYYKRDSKDGKHKKGTATITYKKYRASAPGEPPAVRTGAFRLSWIPKTTMLQTDSTFEGTAKIENRTRTDNGKYLLGEILEKGTGRMAPRPYEDKIKEKAKRKIVKIYSEPYF